MYINFTLYTYFLSYTCSRLSKPDADSSEADGDTLSSQQLSQGDSGSNMMEGGKEKDTVSLPTVEKCGSLVEFVRCYGSLLDGVRLKQLLCSREWGERKACLTALTQAKPVLPGQWG